MSKPDRTPDAWRSRIVLPSYKDFINFGPARVQVITGLRAREWRENDSLVGATPGTTRLRVNTSRLYGNNYLRLAKNSRGDGRFAALAAARMHFTNAARTFLDEKTGAGLSGYPETAPGVRYYPDYYYIGDEYGQQPQGDPSDGDA